MYVCIYTVDEVQTRQRDLCETEPMSQKSRASQSNNFAAILLDFGFAGSVIFHHFLRITLSSLNVPLRDNGRYLLEGAFRYVNAFLRRLPCIDTFDPFLHIDR